MSRSILVLAVIALCLSWAVPAFCEGPTLWQDPQTGQLYAKPADGRVPVDVEKDLNLPPAAVSNLYEDESGAIYSKPGTGRTRIAVTAPTPAPSTTTAQSTTAPADYSSEAFKDAVTHVIGEKEAKTYPKIKLGGLMYGEYYYDFGHKDPVLDQGHKESKNAFQITRGYLNVFGDFSPQISARITSDLNRVVDPSAGNNINGDLEYRLKYYYADFHNFLPFYPSFGVKVGQFQGPWLDYEEGLWAYRVIDNMLIEKEGYINSASLGVDFRGLLPSGYGSWQVSADNGEGYHTDEPNKYKTVEARLTLKPIPQIAALKDLQFSAFAYTGKADRITKRDRYIAFAGYKYHDDAFVGAEYDWTRGSDPFKITHAGVNNVEGHGWSAMAWARMPFLKPLRILGRFDKFRHDDHAPDTTTTRWIYGVSYDVSKNVMFVLNNDRTMYEKALQAKGKKDNNLLKVDMQLSF